MKPLFKTTIIIWTDWDPHGTELSDLAYEAEEGNAYCSKVSRVSVETPPNDPDWDGNEFFNLEEQYFTEPLKEVKPIGDV